MTVIPRPMAHQKLTTKHQTMRWLSEYGSVSVRKTHGEYVVRLEDYKYGKTIKKVYKTLDGALLAAETLKAYYL